MPKKGVCNNPNGRPAGALNKVTAQYRAIVSNLLADMLPKIKEDIQSIDDPLVRIQIFEKLLSYTLPKPSPMAFPLDEGLELKNKFGKVVVIVRESLPENPTDEQIESFINNLDLQEYENKD